MTARPTRKASVAWILLSSRGKRASRISFSFDTRLSPPLPLPPFIRPFFCRVPRRDVHVPSYPSSSGSPLPSSLSRRVRSQPEEEEVLLLEVYVRYELRLFRVSSSSNEDDYNPFSFFVAFHFSVPQNERDAFFFFTVMHGKINGKEGLINFLSTLDFSLIVNRY